MELKMPCSAKKRGMFSRSRFENVFHCRIPWNHEKGRNFTRRDSIDYRNGKKSTFFNKKYIPWKSKTKQRMAFGMIQIKDSPLPMGKVWFLDSLGISTSTCHIGSTPQLFASISGKPPRLPHFYTLGIPLLCSDCILGCLGSRSKQATCWKYTGLTSKKGGVAQSYYIP